MSMLYIDNIKEDVVNAIIKQIQKSLEHGRPVDIKAGPLASKVLQEIRKTKQES